MAPVLPSMFVLPLVQDVFPLLPTDIDFIRQGQHKVREKLNYILIKIIRLQITE